MPVNCPKREAHPWTVRGISTQYTSSFLDGIQRRMLSPPHLFRLVVEAQLREGNPEFCGPARLTDLCPGFPHRVELAVEFTFVVCRMIVVESHAGGRDAEGVRSSAVQKGVERHQHVLGLLDLIAAAERCLDRLPQLALHPRTDVERPVVEHESNIHPVGRIGTLDRLLLNEVGEGGRRSPRLFVELPIYPDGTLSDAYGRCLLRRLACVVGLCERGGGQESTQES